jgi:hypothetical protein
MQNSCECGFIGLEKGELPDPIPWFKEGTILNIEVLNFDQTIGIFSIKPACPHDHHLGNFILGVYFAAGFNSSCGHLPILERNTTYLQICPEHNYIKINIDTDR